MSTATLHRRLDRLVPADPEADIVVELLPVEVDEHGRALPGPPPTVTFTPGADDPATPRGGPPRVKR